jgi:hypothetical protein
MPEKPQDNNAKPDNDGDVDVDLFRRLPSSSPFTRHASNESKKAEDDPIEEFWTTFSMITHTGERFTLTVCFRNKKHFNAEMHKFETAKNMHVVLKDINDESIVLKRDALLHILPAELEDIQNPRKW